MAEYYAELQKDNDAHQSAVNPIANRDRCIWGLICGFRHHTSYCFLNKINTQNILHRYNFDSLIKRATSQHCQYEISSNAHIFVTISSNTAGLGWTCRKDAVVEAGGRLTAGLLNPSIRGWRENLPQGTPYLLQGLLAHSVLLTKAIKTWCFSQLAHTLVLCSYHPPRTCTTLRLQLRLWTMVVRKCVNVWLCSFLVVF